MTNTMQSACFTMSRTTQRLAVATLMCRAFSSSALTIAVITGSTRSEGPPRPINGPRVAKFVQSRLEQRGNKVTVVDPRHVDLGLLQKPHFAYAKSQIPDVLRDIHEVFQTADAYVAVTPEYNHAPSPALLNIMNHFGSSTFGFKPSAIVSYSAGQWGGTRASQALRPVLSELGCLPVSAMIHVPFAQDAFNEDGTVQGGKDEQKRWEVYMDRCFAQVRARSCQRKRDELIIFSKEIILNLLI
jgi:chromate reductase